MTVKLEFKQKHLNYIVDGNKKTTWLLNNKDTLSLGQEIKLADEDGNVAAFAEVEWYKRTRIRFMSREDFRWHPGPETSIEAEQFLEVLYPEENINSRTELTVIRFEVKRINMETDKTKTTE